eukprot:GABV01011888.1.p1 GENE.GABV01011888.1~~GABV01011888.1.p1  ORF type:complete len:110 (-),score=21.63 GABV01011888.1:3-332(-)
MLNPAKLTVLGHLPPDVHLADFALREFPKLVELRTTGDFLPTETAQLLQRLKEQRRVYPKLRLWGGPVKNEHHELAHECFPGLYFSFFSESLASGFWHRFDLVTVVLDA